MPSVEEMDALNCMRDDWGTAYIIEHHPGDMEPYKATRRDDRTVLEAMSPAELRAMIRADYYARPVSRDAAS